MAMKYEVRKIWHVLECGAYPDELRAALQGIENQGGELFSILLSSAVQFDSIGHKIVYYTTAEQSVIKGFEV